MIKRWTKDCTHFPKKGELGITMNYRSITLTPKNAKFYNALLLNHIKPEIDIILRKNQNVFRNNRSTTSQILIIRRIFEWIRAKNFEAILLFVDFLMAFDSINTEKIDQVTLAYGLTKETVIAVMRLHRNMKAKVRSPDGDTVSVRQSCWSFAKKGICTTFVYNLPRLHIRKAINIIYEVHRISFQTFFVWALLLIVYTWNSSPLRSNLLRLQCTCCTVPTTSGRPHRSPLVVFSIFNSFHLLNCLMNVVL